MWSIMFLLLLQNIFPKVSTLQIIFKELFLKIRIGNIFNILNWNAFQTTIILPPPFSDCIYVHSPQTMALRRLIDANALFPKSIP